MLIVFIFQNVDNLYLIFPLKKEEKIKSKTIPVDWCLKTKVRFTSALPFPSRGSFRTFEEVNGTVGFVRCLHSNEAIKKVCNICNRCVKVYYLINFLKEMQ